MSWEERYLEDLLPEIEAYTGQEEDSFTSSDIAQRIDDYTPQKVGKTLKYMVKAEGIDSIDMVGNNPKEWEFSPSSEEPLEEVDQELEPETEDVEEEEIAEAVLEENPEVKEQGLYSVFIDRLKDHDAYETAAESIEKMRDIAEGRKPEVDPQIRELGEQEYGKIRNNIDEVYKGLKDVKEERQGLFRAEHLKDHVENVRGPEVGLVLSGLAAAGLIETYSDREGYVPDSVDLESIQEFRRVVNHANSIENLQDFLDFSEEK